MILKNFTASVDGRGYAGKVKSITLPEITPEFEEIRAGGMIAPIKIPRGVHKELQASVTLYGFEPEVVKLLGFHSAAQVPLTLRGAVATDGDDAAVVISMRGYVSNIDMGTWSIHQQDKDADMEMHIDFTLRYYKLTYNGEDIIETDVLNASLLIGGEEQLSSTQNAIG